MVFSVRTSRSRPECQEQEELVATDEEAPPEPISARVTPNERLVPKALFSPLPAAGTSSFCRKCP